MEQSSEGLSHRRKALYDSPTGGWLQPCPMMTAKASSERYIGARVFGNGTDPYHREQAPHEEAGPHTQLDLAGVGCTWTKDQREIVLRAEPICALENVSGHLTRVHAATEQPKHALRDLKCGQTCVRDGGKECSREHQEEWSKTKRFSLHLERCQAQHPRQKTRLSIADLFCGGDIPHAVARLERPRPVQVRSKRWWWVG